MEGVLHAESVILNPVEDFCFSFWHLGSNSLRVAKLIYVVAKGICSDNSDDVVTKMVSEHNWCSSVFIYDLSESFQQPGGTIENHPLGNEKMKARRGPIDSEELIRESSCLPLFYTHCIFAMSRKAVFISKAVSLRILYIWHILEDGWFSKTTLFFPFISAFCCPGLGTDTLDTHVDRALWTRIKFRLVKGSSSSWEWAEYLDF